jgi:hypothetical protein
VNDKDALTVLTNMQATAEMDAANLEDRVAELNADYAKDPWEDTAAQIVRLTERSVRRRLEAEALAAAVAKF